MDFDEGDNNDGITVIDISNLDAVRYCFVKFGGGFDTTPVPFMTPLPASSYVLDYGDEVSERDQETFDEILASIDSWELVSAHNLHETWPRDNWNGVEVQGHSDEDIDESKEGNAKSSGNQIKSLRASAMDTLLQTSLAQPDSDTALLSEAELLHDYLLELRKKLYEKADNLDSTPRNIQLLAQAFEGVSDFSLGVFRKFGSQDLLALISDLQRNKKMRTLNLSNSSTIDEVGLRNILQITPELRTLYLMNTPSISIWSVLSLLRENNLTIAELYHTDLFRLYLQLRKDDELKFPTGASTKSPVIQLLWVLARSKILRKSASDNDGRPDWDKCNPELKGCFGAFPLEDVLLPPVKLVTGMAQFATFCLNKTVHYSFEGTETFASVATSSFAMASSSVDGSGFQVGPAPLLLPFKACDRWTRHTSSSPFSMMRASQPGDWSIVVVQEYEDPIKGELKERETKWTCAFLTPSQDAVISESDSQFIVMDMTSFLAEVAGDQAQELSEYWERFRRDHREIGTMDAQEVHSLVRGLFTKKTTDQSTEE